MRVVVWLFITLCVGCGRHGFDEVIAGDGDATGDGDNTDAETFVPGVISSAIGTGHTCVVLHDGSLWCWGLNTEGQLGTRDTTSRDTPTRVGTDADWVKVAAGGAGTANGYTCATKRDGSLWCWGINALGGLGTGGGDSLDPVHVGTARWIWIEAGWLATCGIQEDRSLWCWGDNTKGELALGDTTNRPTPTQVGTRTDWARVVSALEFSCAITLDGSGFCWGFNQYGEVSSDPQGTYVTMPAAVIGFRWNTLVAIGRHTCGVRDDGSLWCWGSNVSGQLGLGDFGTGTERNVPALVSAASDWTSVGGSLGGTIAVEDGQLYRWGVMVTSGPFVPTLISTAESWRSVTSSAAGHACAVTVEGRLYCWGDNADGQLGLGGFGGTVATPTLVPLPLP